MSAWMITNDHADFLATAYLRLVDPTADPQAIGRELLHENMRSLTARYETQTDDERLNAYVYREWAAPLKPAWVDCAAACAEYQSCEHGDEWQASDSCRRLEAIQAASGWPKGKSWPDSAPWGIDAKHRDKPLGQPLHAEPANGRIRALLIDPANKSLTEGWLDKGLAGMYATLGCNTIDIVRLVEGPARSIDLVIDDEGKLKTGQHCFRIDDHLIAGRALMVDSDAGGETVGTSLPLAQLRRTVEWTIFTTNYNPEPATILSFDFRF